MEHAAWAEITIAAARSPYPVDLLPVEPTHAAACLSALEITSRSWLGAVVGQTGGILVDHGWVRVLGSGHAGLPDVLVDADPAAGRLVVGYDVLGGRYAWMPARSGARPTVQYFGPDELAWQDLEQGYADWLSAVLAGSLTRFYDTLRWPGWQQEVASVGLEWGISCYPPPWSVEGRDLAVVSRRVVPLAELVTQYQITAEQLGPGDDVVAPR